MTDQRERPTDQRQQPPRNADTAARVWGLVLIVVGAWFFAEFTLGMDLPAIPWRELWPLGLVVIGLVVIVRGMSRRSA